MQQIRQLLNSGYKQGMPAIRITSEDMKPQAFDVYSPKILAAIAGLEDILASRCIAIPMRHTDRKMPAFAPSKSGAMLRHQLYTLALTLFPAGASQLLRATRTAYIDQPLWGVVVAAGGTGSFL